MAAGTYNFTIEQGATFERTFKYKDSEGGMLPLTNHNVTMQIRESLDSDNFVLNITQEGAIKSDGSNISSTKFTNNSTTEVPSNEFGLTIDADTTASMSFDTALYDIELKDNLNKVTRLLQGKIKLSKEITR